MHNFFLDGMRGCAVCLLAAAAQASAAPAGWVAVNAATLDSLRGGFTTPQGLAVSLGVERLVSVNGELVARTSFQLADIGKPGAALAGQTGATLSAIKLVQHGNDNMTLTGFSSDAPVGTVIQNTLNNQLIESRTIIHASVNSVGLLNTINFNGNVSEAIARTVVPR